MDSSTIFFTIASANDLSAAQLMVNSLRAFGGELADIPVWLFTIGNQPGDRSQGKFNRILPLTVSEPLSSDPFGARVTACARAEELAPAGASSLVYMDPGCLVIQSPILFDLGADFDAAFRPVHLRNVGIPPSEPLDAFWKGIYNAAGGGDSSTTITSFVDGQVLRSYFNSHAFAVNPALGLMQRWFEIFRQLLGDSSFQKTACSDETHRIFLFQAILSALVVTSVKPARLRLLPPTYNYPYHLQEQIPADIRLAALNEAVCIAYEDCPILPEKVSGIEIHQPLRAWLSANTLN
jgi:hypothetical protein